MHRELACDCQCTEDCDGKVVHLKPGQSAGENVKMSADVGVIRLCVSGAGGGATGPHLRIQWWLEVHL